MAAKAHRMAINASLATIASEMEEVLSRQVTAYAVGVKDPKTVGRWASGEITEIRNPEVEQRLRTAYTITRMLLEADAPRTVRAWFVGLNPELGDEAPATAIREGRGREALAAARAFLVNG